MDALPGLWSLTPIGGMLGLLALMYWLLATGRLITKGSHERELKMEAKRGDEWKETALETRAVNAEVRTQNTQLIEANRIVESFLRAASPGSIADTQHPGSPDVVA
jgi:hypothetical protein